MKQTKLTRRFLSTGIAGLLLIQSMALPAFAAETDAGAETPQYPYLDTSLSFEERAADLVSRMTLEEKISQLGNDYGGACPAIPRLGVQANRWWNEALHGIARNGPATSFPTGLGLAATWDPEVVREMASMAADEGREKYNTEDHSMTALSYWSPTLNMARDPRWGRTDETYGEDPFLTGQIGDGFVRGLQGEEEENNTPYLKSIATPKHFLANNSEVNRRGGESTVDLRDLREYYTPAFKEAIEVGGARSIMTSYNAVNGVPMSANKPIMEDIVRKTWGFDGFVVTDCGALWDVVNHPWRPDGWDDSVSWSLGAVAAALDAGVDYNCGSVYRDNTKAAYDAGLITEDDIDVALVRLFTARMQVGEFDPAEMVPYSDPEKYGAGKQLHAADHDQMAEDLADQAVVLLKNEPAEGADTPMLPLGGQEEIDHLVLVGHLADEVTLGGYSTDQPGNTSTPVQGIEAALKRYNPEATFTYIPGTQSGVTQDFLMNIRGPKMYDKDGTFLRQIDLNANAQISGGQIENAQEPNTGYFRSNADGWVKFDQVDFTGIDHFTVEMCGMSRAAPTTMELRLGSPTGELLATVSGVGDTSEGTDEWNHWVEYEFRFISGGKEGPLEDVYMVIEKAPGEFEFTAEERATIESADAVVAFVGTGEGDGFEGQDRTSDQFPRGQEDMVNTLLALNKHTVVYMQAIGQMDIESFKDTAPAILWSTYNGQAQGNAAGRLLFGEKDPAAKLPFTWYSDLDQLDSILDYNIRTREATEEREGSNGRTYQYFSGDVTYPFGYGLTYSSFTYSGLTISDSEVTPDDTLKVEFDVTNTSTRDGAEIAQVYVVSPGADKINRPAKRLKGFDKQEIPAGETRHFVIEIPVSELYYWDVENEMRTYDQGVYTIQVGPDSANTPLTQDFTLSGQLTPELHAVTALPSGNILDADHPEKTISIDLTASYNNETFVDLAQDGTVVYSSNKPEVAQVSADGIVTPVAPGTATITASVTVGGRTMSSSFPVAVTSDWAPTAENIYVDGQPLPGFEPDVLTYSVGVDSLDELPEVTAAAADGATVSVVQATKENPTATVTASQAEGGYLNTVYQISFVIPPKSFDFTRTTEQEVRDGWTIQHEDAEAWSVGPDGLTVTTQRGDFGYANEPAKNVFLQSGMGDWRMDAKVTYSEVPSKSFQQAGILVYQDDQHLIKLDYEWKGGSSGACIQFVYYDGGGLVACGDLIPYNGTEIYYRIEKQGNRYTGSYSPDGQEYMQFGTITLDLANSKLGLMAINGPSQYGGVTDPIDVTFEYLTITQDQPDVPATGITLDRSELSLAPEATFQLTATVEPENATDKEVTWTSSDETVATVDENGLVTAVAEGSVTITAATANGLSAACAVTVQEPVAGKDLSVAVSGADMVKQDQRVPYTFSFSGEKENLGNVTVVFNIKGDPAGLFTGGAFEAGEGFSKYVMDEEEQADGSRRVKVVLAYGMDELTALEEAALTDELTDLFTYVIRSSAEQEGEIEVTVEQAIFTYAEDNDLYYADVTGATASTAVSAKDPYDIDGDGDFDQADITAAQGYYRAAEGDENWDEARKADVNRDGVVDLTDLVELATAWLDTL